MADMPRPTSPDDDKDYKTYWENVKAVHQVRGLQIQLLPLNILHSVTVLVTDFRCHPTNFAYYLQQDGKYGSVGYRYPWAGDEALRLVLRTHTTAVSARMLHKLAAKKGPNGRPPPARYFSIDRVFRNESVDATHLAEFHQVEGVIADYDLTLGGLMEVSHFVSLSSFTEHEY